MSGTRPASAAERLAERFGIGDVVRRIAANASWLGGESMLRLLIGLPMTIWLTRYLGPREFGSLSFALAICSILIPLAALGLDRITVRELVERPSERGTILGTVFTLRSVAGLALYAAALAAVMALRPGDAPTLRLVAVAAALVAFKAFDVIDLSFQADVASRTPAVARSGVFGVATAARAALLLLAAPTIAFAWAWLGEGAIAAAALVFVYTRLGGSLGTWRLRRATAAAFLRDGWPIALASAMVLVYTRIDQIMLEQMRGSAELGVYAVAVRLVEATYFIPTVVVASAFPSVLQARAESESAFEARLERLYRSLAFAGYAVILPMALLAWWYVPLLFGPAYRGAAPVTAVLACSILFTNLGVARGAYLTAMNWMKAYLFTVALGCAVNVVLNLIWIPRWGAMGAALASLVAYWVAAHGSCYLYRPLWRTGAMLTRALVRPGIARLP